MARTALVAIGVVAWGCGDETVSTGAGGAGGSGGATTSATSTTSTGTGGNPIGDDTCPGAPVSLSHGSTFQTTADTSQAADDLAPFCGGAGAPDLVYQVELTQAGTFAVSVDVPAGSTLDPVLALRLVCTDGSVESCFDFPTKHEELRFHAAAGIYAVIVDGASGSQGSFTVQASLSAPACGDATLNPGELCDDGNTNDDDGCSSQCQIEPPPATGDVCPGEVYVLNAGTFLVEGTTTNFKDDAVGSCNGSTGGRDRVLQIEPAITGKMSVNIGYEADGTTETCVQHISDPACWDRVLYLRTSCDDTGTELACSDSDLDGNAVERLVDVDVVAGQKYFLFVDGYDGEYYSAGAFHMFISLK